MIQTSQMRRVAIYGRVSSEHEEQISAFHNQQDWYELIAQQHPNWNITGRYFDEGITGTAMKKRPAFMQMLDDAHQGQFDLIVTREVCRFARNTVDALTATRELRHIGVEVYFIQDNIWTMDPDGEFRLTFMATFAQEESRKISERARAGQQISREKGVLYGTENILGYDRVDGTYVINPEQAYTVQKIFNLYAAGWGYKSICAELIRLGCENTLGVVKWEVARIGQILRNATYKGYLVYNKSTSDDYLTQKRIKNPEQDHVYVKGTFDPIVSEELWNYCESLRIKKTIIQKDTDGAIKRSGCPSSQSVWHSKLRCNCGSSFRYFLWHENLNGKQRFGYECYKKRRDISANIQKKLNLGDLLLCQTKDIPSWHIDLMAKIIFNALWKTQKGAILTVCQAIESCSVSETTIHCEPPLSKHLKQKLDQLQKQRIGLKKMRALEEILKEEFLQDYKEINAKIVSLQMKIQDLEFPSKTYVSPNIDLSHVRITLNSWLDADVENVPDILVEQFVQQVIVVDDNTFYWILNFPFSLSTTCTEEYPIVASLNLCQKPRSSLVPNSSNAKSRPMFSFTVTKDDAKAYCRLIGMKFIGKKWTDKKSS